MCRAFKFSFMRVYRGIIYVFEGLKYVFEGVYVVYEATQYKGKNYPLCPTGSKIKFTSAGGVKCNVLDLHGFPLRSFHLIVFY